MQHTQFNYNRWYREPVITFIKNDNELENAP
jgi:hypothetical protein